MVEHSNMRAGGRRTPRRCLLLVIVSLVFFALLCYQIVKLTHRSTSVSPHRQMFGSSIVQHVVVHHPRGLMERLTAQQPATIPPSTKPQLPIVLPDLDNIAARAINPKALLPLSLKVAFDDAVELLSSTSESEKLQKQSLHGLLCSLGSEEDDRFCYEQAAGFRLASSALSLVHMKLLLEGAEDLSTLKAPPTDAAASNGQERAPFLQGTERTILDKLSMQAKKMKERFVIDPPDAELTGGVVDDVDLAMLEKVLAEADDNTGANFAKSRASDDRSKCSIPSLHTLGLRQPQGGNEGPLAQPAVHIVSARALAQAPWIRDPQSIRQFLDGSDLTYILLSKDYDSPALVLMENEVLNQLQQAAADSKCAVASLWDDGVDSMIGALGLRLMKVKNEEKGSAKRKEERRELLAHRTVALSTCSNAKLMLSRDRSRQQNDATPKTSSSVMIDRSAHVQGDVFQLPLLCRNDRTALRLKSTIKWGTKTAIFKAVQSVSDFTNRTQQHEDEKKTKNSDIAHRDVVVKMFHVKQYLSFFGFHTLMSSPFRHPSIHYPSSSCYDPTYEAIFQVQPLISKAATLYDWIRASPSPPARRVELALQIGCLFDHFHRHPSGSLFSYDDNHLLQYMIQSPAKQQQQAFDNPVELQLVDIDTIQLAQRPNSSSGLVVDLERRARTRCRCYYCKGKANCQFVNSPEGYEGCGQTFEASREAGDVRDPASIPKGRHCSPLTDQWFLGQIFSFVSTSHIVWKNKEHFDVLKELAASKFPILHAAHGAGGVEAVLKEIDGMDKIVMELYSDRTRSGRLVEQLQLLCELHHCKVRQCPVVQNVSTALYSTPFTHAARLRARA